jgi:hypothetical protein
MMTEAALEYWADKIVGAIRQEKALEKELRAKCPLCSKGISCIRMKDGLCLGCGNRECRGCHGSRRRA